MLYYSAALQQELNAKEQVRSATTYSSCYGNKPT